MFRPNRIGHHQVIDISSADFALDQTAANFLASEGTISAHQVQAHSTAVPLVASAVHFDTVDVHAAWNLTAKKSWSFGIFVSGVALNDKPMMLSYAATVYIHLNSGLDEVATELNIGSANASTVTVDKTTTTNLMRTKCLLAVSMLDPSKIWKLTASGTLINTIVDGGASGLFDENPIGLWFAIVNHEAATTADVRSVIGSMSLYRYSEDIDTFDPNR